MDQFVGESFLTMDPGVHGKVLAYEKGNPHPVLVCSPRQPEDLSRLMRVTGARVLVVEQQYVTSLQRARSVVELSFGSGLAIGWLCCTRAPVHATHLFEVAPASWQAHQRGHVGRAKKGEANALMMAKAAEFVRQFPAEPFCLWWNAEVKAGKEGLAAALAMGEFWKHTAWPA